MNTLILIARIILLISLLATLLSACSAPLTVPSAAPAGSEHPAPEAGSAAGEYDSSEAAPAHGDGAWATATPNYPTQSGQYEPVTAGVTDDNAEWQAYLDYRERHDYLWVNDRDISERYLIQVVDQNSLPVHDATVTVYAGKQELFVGRTDAGGRLYFHPRALDQGYALQQTYEFRLVASKGYVAQSQTVARSGGGQWTITLADPPRRNETALDLLFLLDATGSMGDEIDKLKTSMADIADQIARLPEQPDVRYGLVIYRDRGDRFVTRSYDFTRNLGEFQHTLAAVRADGGGDTPESLNEALAAALQKMSWRDEDAVRLILLVGDAPPHLDYGEYYTYDVAMIDAVARGIKIFPVGASNLDETGEYVFRQLAQFTGGKFVFLTYEEGSNPSSGPGTETEHDVETYSVDTLDRLIVRLVREELAQLAAPVALQQQPSPTAPPTVTPQPAQPHSCMYDLQAGTNTCGEPLIPLPDGSGQLLGIYNILQGSTYDRVRLELFYDSDPEGATLRIEDAVKNEGHGRQFPFSDIEIVDRELTIYGNASQNAMPQGADTPLPYILPNAVGQDQSLTLEIEAGRVAISSIHGIEVLTSPALFTWAPQTKQRGATDLALYFYPTHPRTGRPKGLSKVTLTYFPAD
jgi:hypothetical protein